MISNIFIDLSIEHYNCVNNISNINSMKIHDELLKLKKKCSDVRDHFEKCQIIHDRLDKVFINKQKLYLDEMRRELCEKERKKN